MVKYAHKAEGITIKFAIVLVFALSAISIGANVATSAHAAEICVGASATGDGSGSNWANRAQWSTLSFTRGNTYFLIKGTYEYRELLTAESGSKYITIKKATASSHGSNTGWSSSNGDGQAVLLGFYITTGYWELDGATRNESDWTDGDSYGFKIDTINGSSRAIHIPWREPNLVTNGLKFKYIYIEGHGRDGGAGTNDLYYSWTYNSTGNLIHRCFFYNSGGTHIFARGEDYTTVEYCYFWKNESTAEEHSESFSCDNFNDNWTVRYNVFREIEGTGVLMYRGSGWKVYGNVFRDSEFMGNGIFAGWSAKPMSNAYFYNNTIVNVVNCGIGFDNDTNVTSKNNIFYGCTSNSFKGTHDYNAFSGANAFGETNGQVNLPSSIFVNYGSRDLRLTGPTPPGQNLGSEYNQDPLGAIRGGESAWNRGAYEYSVGGATPPETIIRPPIGIRIFNQQ